MNARPNILCLVSEDCPPWIGAYGGLLASTPNLDRLAAEGVTFDNASCTAPVCAPSRFAILTGFHAESAPPAQHMTACGTPPRDLVTYPEMMRAAGYYCTNNSKTHYNIDIDPSVIWDETSGTAHWMNRPAGAPFLAVFNTMLTHESCIFEEQPGSVGPRDVVVPAYLPDTEGVRISLARYCNRISVMDRWMGERLAELDAAGLADDTIVFYFSDHGSPLPRSKRLCYEEGLRVPLIVRVPEKWRRLLPENQGPGSRSPSPVSLVDLLPTFASLAGVPAPPDVQGLAFLGPMPTQREFSFSGRGRMDERYDFIRTARSARFRYIRNYAPHRIYGQYSAFAWNSLAYQDYETAHLEGRLDPVRARFWKPKPAEELYDLHADPQEIVNLVDDAGYFGVLEDMRAALDEHMLAIHDCGFIPEGSPVEEEHKRSDPDLYPLTRVMALAASAIRRDPAEIAHFIGALDRANPSVIRYWGAQGLLILAVAGHDLPDDLNRLIADEDDPRVLIALLEARGHGGKAEGSVRLLTFIFETEKRPEIRLQALNALTELPLFAEITHKSVAAALDDPDEYVRGACAYLNARLTGCYRPTDNLFRFDLLAAQQGRSGIVPQHFPALEEIVVGR
ncbi:sulfatase-like hydrolase/transferase [Martelella sp. FOR1707]